MVLGKHGRMYGVECRRKRVTREARGSTFVV